MRGALAVFALVAVASLAASPANAGVLELAVDEVSRNRHCDVEPCRRNGLEETHRYVKGRYLRYDIDAMPPEYEWRPSTVLVSPPKVVLRDRPGDYRWADGKWLLVATPKRASKLAPGEEEYVVRRVLARPAKYRVTRQRPTAAYYRQRMVVEQQCVGYDLFGFCRKGN